MSANIDAKGIDGIYPLSLGYEENAFTGVFINPNKCWISNLSITPKEDPDFSNVFHSSLFGSVYKAYIARIVLKNFVTDSSMTNETCQSASIADSVIASYLGNCEVEGSVKGPSVCGGIVGGSTFSLIENCSFSGNVSSSLDGTGHAFESNYSYDLQNAIGGVAGFINANDFGTMSGTTLKNVSVEGNLFGLDGVGGIIGSLFYCGNMPAVSLFASSSFKGTIICSGENKGLTYGFISFQDA